MKILLLMIRMRRTKEEKLTCQCDIVRDRERNIADLGLGYNCVPKTLGKNKFGNWS